MRAEGRGEGKLRAKKGRESGEGVNRREGAGTQLKLGVKLAYWDSVFERLRRQSFSVERYLEERRRGRIRKHKGVKEPFILGISLEIIEGEI